MECGYCGFVVQSKTELRRHARSARCRQGRTILFCCKQCPYTGHSLADIYIHPCQLLGYKHNEMERLRGELTLSSCVVTTTAELEWNKMNVNLNVIRHALKNESLTIDEITTKSVLMKCKEKNVPISVVQALIEQKRRFGAWLNDEAPGLPLPQEEKKRRTNNGSILCPKSVSQINNNQWQDLFFVFTMHRRCDVDHYFKLLFSKADANYWPFCLTNERILELCFRSSLCPIIRRGQQFFVCKTKQPLQNVILELDYGDWVWICIPRDDLYRYIHQEWILQHFHNIVVMLEKNTDFLSNDDAAKIEEKYSNLIKFVRFWSNPEAVLDAVFDAPYVHYGEDIKVECTQVETEFEDVIKARSSRRNAVAWKLLLQMLNPESPGSN